MFCRLELPPYQRSHCARAAKAKASGLSEAGSHGQLNDQAPSASFPNTAVIQLFGVLPLRVRI